VTSSSVISVLRPAQHNRVRIIYFLPSLASHVSSSLLYPFNSHNRTPPVQTPRRGIGPLPLLFFDHRVRCLDDLLLPLFIKSLVRRFVCLTPRLRGSPLTPLAPLFPHRALESRLAGGVKHMICPKTSVFFFTPFSLISTLWGSPLLLFFFWQQV